MSPEVAILVLLAWLFFAGLGALCVVLDVIEGEATARVLIACVCFTIVAVMVLWSPY